MANWQSVDLNQIVQLPEEVTGVVNGVRGILDPTIQFLEAISSVLNVIRAFINDDGNAISTAASEVNDAISDILGDTQSAGVYLYLDFPLPPGVNGNLAWGENSQGGFEGFKQRIIAKFVDPTDPNRPSFSEDSSYAVFILGANTGSIFALMRQIGSLFSLLGQQFTPRLDPPQNVSARAINESFFTNFIDKTTGKISLSAVSDEFPLFIDEKVGSMPAKTRIFTSDLTEIVTEGEPDAIRLTWQAPQSFYPTAFVVERSTVRGGVPAQTTDENGDPVLNEIRSNIPDPENEGAKRSKREVSIDNEGRVRTIYPDFRDEKNNVPDSNAVVSALFQGPFDAAAGFFEFIDRDAKPGIPYFYRVRAKYGNEVTGLAVASDLIEVPEDIKDSVAGKALAALLEKINDLRLAEGEPSEEVSAYIPIPAERDAAAIAADAASDRLENNPYFGGPPNWSRASIDNVFPYFGLILKLLNDEVKKLKVSSGSNFQEVEALIATIQLKIDTLNKVLKIIDAILAVLEALSLPGFSVLAVANTTGGVPSIIEEIANAGNSPDSSPDDYAAGLVIMAGGPGSGHLQDALNFLLAPLNKSVNLEAGAST